MKKISYVKPIFVLFAIMVLSFISCEKEATNEVLNDELELFTESSIDEFAILDDVTTNDSRLKSTETSNRCGEYKIYPLIASQHYFAGALVVSNDDKNLYVSYVSTLKLTEFHLFVGDAEDFPLSGGNNPKIGHFPYTVPSANGMYINTFTIPLSDIPDCYTLAAHAVYKTHTIWAKSCKNSISFAEKFGSHRWGWVIEDCKEVCSVEKIIAMKTWFVNTVTKERFWGTIADIDNNFPEHCTELGIIKAKTGVYELIDYYGNLVGQLSISIEGSNLKLVISALDGSNYVIRSHVFYGTEPEFESYIVDECPDYKSFPLFKEELLETHEFIIPLN